MDMSLCPDCVGVISKAWAVGERNSVIQRVIGDFKFQRMRSAYRDLGDLLNGVLPVLPDNTVIVPIPTTNPHIRERGYDHMLLIAKYLAKKRRLKYQRILYRKTNTKQRQADNKQRDKQASQAFGVRNFNLDSSIPYLIIDDVYTTGATVKYAAKELKKAGAKIIWVAVIAKQVNT